MTDEERAQEILTAWARQAEGGPPLAETVGKALATARAEAAEAERARLRDALADIERGILSGDEPGETLEMVRAALSGDFTKIRSA